MLTYPDLEIAIHSELKNLRGLDPASAETLFASPLTAGSLLMPDYPLTRVRRAALASVAEIAKAIAENDKHPQRATFRVQEGPITQLRAGTLLQDSLGPYGTIRDNSSGAPLRQNTLSAITRLLDPDLAGVYDESLHDYYCIDGQRIYFVCPSGTANYERFVFEVPGLSVFTWTSGTEASKTATPLTDNYANLAISGAIRMLAIKTDPALAQLHEGEFMAGMAAIRAGIQPVTLPAHPKQ